MGSSPYRRGGGRRGPSLPPRAGEDSPGYEPYPVAESPGAARGPGDRDAGWMRHPPTPAPHDQPWPAAPHERPSPAATHDQPRAAAPHERSSPAAMQDQPWLAASHDQPRAAGPHERPWSAAAEPPPLRYDQDPWRTGQMPGPATATSQLPPGPAPDRFEPHPSGPLDFGPPGRLQDPRGGRVPGWRNHRLLPAAAAVVAVALLAGIAIIMTRHAGGTAGHAVRSTPSASGRTEPASSGRGSRRATAPDRISTAMIFPHAHVTADGIKFRRVIAVLNQECKLTARAAFASALTSAGCVRVARATFVDNAKRYAITAGVAELPSPAAASHVDRSKDLRRDVWFTGLDGPAHSGATAVSTSVGLGYNIVYGRYIIYSLATYSSGRNPTGHAAAIKTLKDLARSFAVMSRQPLTTHGN